MPRPRAPRRLRLRLAPLAALASLALVTVACGDDGSASESATEGSTSSTTDAATTTTTGETTAATETTGGTDTDATGGLEPAEVPTGCNPIAYEHDCLLPYPSDVFLIDDPEAPGSKRVALTVEATPTTMEGISLDTLSHHVVDGFSHHQPILAVFPEGVDTSNLNFHVDGGDATLDPASPTILLNADTGELVPHWVELDAMTASPAEQALILRPLVVLDDGARYIVAYQGLVSAMGLEIAPPKGFAHILAGAVEGDGVLEPLAARYESTIFPDLAAAGVARERLQLAWEFTTASDERNTRDMLAIRDDMIAWLADNDPAVMVDKVLPDHNEDIALRIEGRVQVPLYLEEDAPMALLHRDADGHVVANGEHWVAFTFQVPTTAFPLDPNYESARIIQFGHGFFGEREEINWSAMRGFSVERGLVMVATEWVGMAYEDQASVIEYIGKQTGDTFLFTDRLHQAFANQIALTAALKTTMTKTDEFFVLDQLIYDPDQLHYYGISQGSIFGAVFMALTPTIERGVLSVGGGPYSLMMSRSGSFKDLFALMKLQIGERPLEIQKFITLSQHVFDRVDPATYARRMIAEPYADSPERRILFQYGIGDHSVNNLASHLLIRAGGLDMLAPTAEQPYGVDTVDAPAPGSAAVAVDYNLAVLPGINAELPPEPPSEENVHELVRRNAKIRDQIDAFWQPDGVLDNFCDGPCDPE
ncbi:MAG: hypothetical protein R3A79_04935 [Nannocystaceae bacterium]